MKRVKTFWTYSTCALMSSPYLCEGFAVYGWPTKIKTLKNYLKKNNITEEESSLLPPCADIILSFKVMMSGRPTSLLGVSSIQGVLYIAFVDPPIKKMDTISGAASSIDRLIYVSTVQCPPPPLPAGRTIWNRTWCHPLIFFPSSSSRFPSLHNIREQTSPPVLLLGHGTSITW